MKYDAHEKRREKRKISWRYIKTSVMTPPVPSQISQRDESNDFEKGYQR
jgi:hypothetical protein